MSAVKSSSGLCIFALGVILGLFTSSLTGPIISGGNEYEAPPPPPPPSSSSPSSLITSPSSIACKHSPENITQNNCQFDDNWIHENLMTYSDLISASAVSTGAIDWNGMGHVGQYHAQHFAYFTYARDPAVKQVCEIGFNAGHSSIAFLVAKSTNTLLTFDIGELKWSSHQHNLFKNAFKERFELHVGDSQITVPRFIKENPNWRGCDLVSIDGAHNEPFVQRDLENMIQLANIGARFIFDDYDWPAVDKSRKWARDNGILGDEECIDKNHVVGGYKKAWCTAILRKK